ncbi:MAG: hypothetical protein DRR19_30705 [Candidatus Parabeggiatoa sp. nov. 1]|nr:MAG: hypothetical protein DRR19_30705 [Gammaproteobacteria bacterium]
MKNLVNPSDRGDAKCVFVFCHRIFYSKKIFARKNFQSRTFFLGNLGIGIGNKSLWLWLILNGSLIIKNYFLTFCFYSSCFIMGGQFPIHKEAFLEFCKYPIK